MIRCRKGMTLLELVIALVVTGLMAGVGASAFAAIIDNRRGILQATSTTERAAALHEALHSWLVSSTVQVQQGGTASLGGRTQSAMSALRTVAPGTSMSSTPSVTPAVVSGDVLSFSTTAPNPANAPQATMRLFIDDDASTPEKGLTLEYQANSTTPLIRIELDSTITAMTVEYLDQTTNRWFDASQGATISPEAVRLTLQAPYNSEAYGIIGLPIVVPMATQNGNARRGGN